MWDKAAAQVCSVNECFQHKAVIMELGLTFTVLLIDNFLQSPDQ
jgi:hypothetical protein